MDTIYIYSPAKGCHGIDVIVRQLIPAIRRKGISCELIDNLDGIPENARVFPYTMDPAMECLKKGYHPELCFSMDALTLGYWNKIWFYLKHMNIFQYDFAYCIAAFVFFMKAELKICQKYNRIVLVSPTDIDYLVNISKQSKDKFIYVANGVEIPGQIKPKTKSDKLRFGLLASWGAKQTYQESAWFVKEYFSRYAMDHPNVELRLIGRGPYIERLRGIRGVNVIGEVESLNDVFADIDIFIGANPKGCGVLNRVLDAMSFKTPILSLPECFTGLPDSEGLYFPYTDYKSFALQVNYILHHREEANLKAEKCFEYIKEHNNWQRNYDEFVSKILL